MRVLTRRDLAAGTTTVIATDASNSTNDVVSNGDIVYSTCCDLPSPLAYDIVRYRNGVASRLTNDDEAVLRNVDPVTDGTNVIYAKYDASVNQLATEAVTLSGTETLAARTPGQTPSHLRYAVSNGWIAFDRPVLGGIAQVFRRSPTGVESQVSFFGQGAEVTALAPDGSVVFLNVADQHYYIRRPGGSPLELGSRLGRLRFVGTDAYVIIAGTLLRLR